ncbi:MULTISPECIES: hypothetical protein [Lysinibacillus]|uniref:hypothetical protein n=1 Tax=Lysinibacillus TaxID=400634 RepID=UPI00237DDA7C|nr:MULTISPECIES: hypothetical protein [Lysinibacillus]MED4552786.1 hypothetical protein [Lysinibacillus capsici]WDU80948.1 hypothetical protein PSR12_07225 [Lysinibacillus sp. G01H]
MFKQRKWISKEILNWESYSDSSTVLEKEKGERAFQIWGHAKNLIVNNESEFHLADGITNLKRALNHRLKLIEEIYGFKFVEINNKPKGYMEILEIFVVVRPFLMKRLLTIRNGIEHNDEKPPSYERCIELLDVVWYFLKSTDLMVQFAVNDLAFELEVNDDKPYYFVLEYVRHEQDIFIINGNIPEKLIYDEFTPDTIEVVLGEIEGIKDIRLSMAYEGKVIELPHSSIHGEIILSDFDKIGIINKFVFSY